MWGIDASLEELRGKTGDAVKCAIPKSEVAYSNIIATRYKRGLCHLTKRAVVT